MCQHQYLLKPCQMKEVVTKKKKSVFWIWVLEMPSIVMLSKQRKVD